MWKHFHRYGVFAPQFADKLALIDVYKRQEYVKGKREGYGTYMFPDGEKYEGQGFQDQQHGRGIYYFMNNNRYDGMWFKDYQHGTGTMLLR